MARRGENNERGAVPQFGAWDQIQSAGGEYTSYSVVFSKAREKKKQAKTEVPNIINNNNNTNEELGPSHAHHDASDRPHTFDAPRPRPRQHHHHHHNPHPHSHNHPNSHPPHPQHHSHSPSHEPQSSSHKEESSGMKKLRLYFGGCTRP